MTARMYYDNDADPAALAGQTVAIIGYGSQGHAHALNLHESGVDVVVGLAPGSKSRALAEEAGLRVADVADAVQGRRRRDDPRAGHGPEGRLRRRDRAEPAPGPAADVRPRLQHPVRADRARRAIVDVGMVAPKGPGHLLRSVYQAGGGVPALFAVERDASGTARDRVLAYARGARLDPGRRPRDDVRRGDRDRPVRRAGAAVRRRRRRWSRWRSRRSSRPATSPSSRTSRRCTSSS